MRKEMYSQSRTTRTLVVVTVLLLVAIGSLAVSRFFPLEAAPLTQEEDATPTPDIIIMGHGMMGSDVMSATMPIAGMGAMMDQMLAHMNSMMPMSGTMPIYGMMPMSGTMPMYGAMPMYGMMPMSGTMPMHTNMSTADMGMMMQMMGIMQHHLGYMQMMLGAMMSSGIVDDTSAMGMLDDTDFGALFIDGMIEHHQGAIAMAETMLEQAEHEELLTLAEAIITAQTAEIEQLQAWRSEWYPDLAPTGGMQMDMGAMMISEDESVPIDQRFIEAMILHHQGAINMAEMALEQAEQEEIRTLAETIITAQTAEIEQMQGWLAEWYDITD